jgi:hypothetical protein
MANKERGELKLTAGSQSYTMRLTTNAACELEELAGGRTLEQVVTGCMRGSSKDVRFLLWACLREHHPDVATDDKDGLKAIGRIMDDAGGLTGIAEQLQALLKLNADDAEDGADNPPPGAPAEPSGPVGVSFKSTRSRKASNPKRSGGSR